MASYNPDMNQHQERRRHIICERDAGLFSLFQQVVGNIPWAMHEKRIPIVYFGDRCCYWAPRGYRDKDTVWEYYFEPLVASYPVSIIPDHIRAAIRESFPRAHQLGYLVDEDTWVSNNFADHPKLKGKTVAIPYRWNDPDDELRKQVSAIIQEYVRPRAYIEQKVNHFYGRHMKDNYVIGVHVRGTDAILQGGVCAYRKDSLVLPKYVDEIHRILTNVSGAIIFVATDDNHSLAYIRDAFGRRVIACDSVRHDEGPAAGRGPMGWLMPAYIAGDRERAARNGEEAVIEYLLLTKCHHLVHNGAGLARTVLLTSPHLPHTNTHRKNKWIAHMQMLNLNEAKRIAAVTLQRAGVMK